MGGVGRAGEDKASDERIGAESEANKQWSNVGGLVGLNLPW